MAETSLSDGGFDQIVSKLMTEGFVERVERGWYELTEKGRLSLNV